MSALVSKSGELKVVKYGASIQVSRSVLLDAGAVEPTDEERATLEAQRRDWEQRKHAEREAVAAFASTLPSITDPVARVVLDLHKDDSGICAAEQDWDGYGPSWPCQTVVTVATTLGIAVPPHLVD